MPSVNPKETSTNSNEEMEINKGTNKIQCGITFFNDSDVNMHIKTGHMIRHECNQCDKKYVNKYDLNNHILKQHQKRLELKEKSPLANLMAECTDLMEEYNETEPAQEQPDLTRHHNHAPQIVSLSSKIALFKCDQCDKSFIDKLCLENHIQDKHKNELCNICNLIFGSKDELEKHQKTNHKSMSETYHKCNKCKKGYTSIDLLRLHVKFVCGKNDLSIVKS